MDQIQNKMAVEMTGLGKRYGHAWILARLDLSIKRGESIALFGRNGSGKSTLLKIIATLSSPSCGNLRVLGFDARTEKAEIRRKIRLLGHEKQLYDSLTIRENLKLAAVIRGVPSKEASSKIDALVERFQIARARDRRVDQLSEGMKKRVVLARLLLGTDEPDLVILDEPHPTLDIEGRRLLGELIQKWRETGKTILLASHDHSQALMHADRLLVLEKGGIGYDGPPSKWSGVWEAVS